MIKTRFFQLLFFIPILGFSQYTAIPDTNFEKSLIELGIDDLVDGKVLSNKIKHVKSLDLAWKEISDLTGIQGFDSLQKLDCSANPFITLDLSKNTALLHLDLDAEGDYTCKITSLDLSNNTELTYLDCGTSDIKKLNLSKNIALKELYCSWCKIKTIDLSNNIELVRLEVSYNKLKRLDLSNNTKLLSLDVGNNRLKDLVLDNNTSLKSIYCAGNKFDCKSLLSKY